MSARSHEDFERLLNALQNAGVVPDPRGGQITRLKQDNATLRKQMSDQPHIVGQKGGRADGWLVSPRPEPSVRRPG